MKKVITYGSFDLFHEGHYRLLERAKALGDYLIAGVTTARYDESRGKLNVVDSLTERIDNVRKTGFVDEIVVEDHIGQKVEDVIKHKIDVFTVGSDWAGAFDYLKDYCEVVYLERTKDISSTMLRAKNYNILRVGIIGSGRIASRFAVEARYVSGVNIRGVFNPRFGGAGEFAKRHRLALATDNLEELFSCCDAVYVASPHETHREYITLSLSAGKHVLCEKPMSLKREDCAAAFELAARKRLVLMEAMKTALCPGFSQLYGVVRSGEIGSVRDVEACFTKLVPKTSREWTGGCPGAFTELASYPLFAIARFFGCEYSGVRFESFFDENGADYYSKAYFRYPNGLATAKVGIGVKSEGEMIISGTTGYIVVKAPWWRTTEFEVRRENPNQREPFYSRFLGDGLRYELSGFLSLINGGEGGRHKITAEESCFMADIIEQFGAFAKTRAEGSV
jgi:glycerol-3-phosphate cytidylyltransferase